MVPLEAMACEAPVIGVAEGGLCETIEDGRTGFLIDRHPQQFADAAERLLRDPALAAACGAEGRRSVLARWTWEASMRQLDSHLKDCVEK